MSIRPIRIVRATAILAAFAGPLAPARYAQDGPVPVRAWVDQQNVTMGSPFWLHLEATGTQIEMPRTIQQNGLAVDPINIRNSTIVAPENGTNLRTVKRGYYVRALRPGPLLIRPIEVTIDGRLYATEPIPLRVFERPAGPADLTGGDFPPKEDLVFIEMEVDRQEVYQGEPIYLRTQLWRIADPNVNAGPFEGSLIEPPSHEGFYVKELEPRSFPAHRGDLQYDVWEERKLLYPTIVGNARIGRWHWEGVALLNRKNFTRRDRLYYDLNAGPIEVLVKPLPPGPPEFSGAVGSFSILAALGPQTVRHGETAKLSVTITGRGNADAVGAPKLPSMDDFQVSPADVQFGVHASDNPVEETITKRFTYALTPLREGELAIPPIRYPYFDPEADEFVTLTTDPITLVALPSGEIGRHVAVSNDVSLGERRIDVLGDDIRPVLDAPRAFHQQTDRTLSTAAALSLPMIAYAGLALLTGRRRGKLRAAARGEQARRRAAERLRAAATAPAPGDVVYQTLAGYLNERFGEADVGLTAVDAARRLDQLDLDEALCRRVTAILDACERARYGAALIEGDTLASLIAETQAVLRELDTAWGRKGPRP